MTLLNDISEIIPAAGHRLKADELMSRHTTFQVGGKADIFIDVVSSAEISGVIGYCQNNYVPYTIIGNGSNILVSDRGIRGVIISIGEGFSGIERNLNTLIARAGTRLSALAAFAARNSLSGLEFASGIPGTLGGAILMNAGAYDHCMAEIVVSTEFLDHQLEHQKIVGQEHQFAYRFSYFMNHESIILGSQIELEPDEPHLIYSRMADLAERRRASQPLDLPSAGSAFKRPDGSYAAKLIHDCGLRGYRIGDAQVSEKHCGFIVNLGSATATDVRHLFELVQQRVADQTGIFLEPEVRFIGDW